MSNKRPTLRPTGSMFRRTDQGVPELQNAQTSGEVDAQDAEPQDVQPADDPGVLPPEGLDVQTAEPSDVEESEPPTTSKSLRWRKRKKVQLEQVTVYLEPSDVEAMTIYQLQHYQKTRQKIERSEIVRQALRAWLSQSS
jgi:hypothetical protein